MHLAIVTALPPSQGTLNEYGQHLVQAFAEKLEVSRLTIIADQTPLPETLTYPRTTIERVWQFNRPDTLWKIRQAVIKHKPDAVLFNLQFSSFGSRHLPAALGLLTPLMLRHSGFPTITLLHNLMETVNLKDAGFALQPWREKVVKIGGRILTHALLGSDHLAVTMPEYVQILEQQYRAKNVFHAPHGAFSERTPKELPPVRTIMTFGKFGTYKKLEPLIEAHQMLLAQDPSIRLVIGGSDSPNNIGYVASIKHRYASAKNITYTGYVPEAAVPQLFEDSTVVVFPYTSTTGSSGVLHQAGEFARAAVMPTIGDLEALVKCEGYTAEFFEAGNSTSLAIALWKVLSNRQYATQMGLHNHKASGRLLISEVANLYLEAFHNLKHIRSATEVRQWKSRSSNRSA
jgi:glycosyltransferase involved in cell wall biosynthesis